MVGLGVGLGSCSWGGGGGRGARGEFGEAVLETGELGFGLVCETTAARGTRGRAGGG